MSSKKVPNGYHVHQRGGGLVSDSLEVDPTVYIADLRVTGEGKIIRGFFSVRTPLRGNVPQKCRINIKDASAEGWFKVELMV